MLKGIECHQTTQIGKRPTNEDVEISRLNLRTNGSAVNEEYAPIDIFIICDGHGGSRVSEYVAPLLLKLLAHKNNTYPISQQKINNIYNKIQLDIFQHPKRIGNGCGCTALVVIRYKIIMGNNMIEKIQTINLGDCRAVVSRNGLAIPLSKDHKPFWSDEKKRIQLLNQKNKENIPIHYSWGDWRVHDLSVSRAFGDNDEKPEISNIPDIYDNLLENNDEFLIIACDGLWDVLQNHEAVNFVRDHIKNNMIDLYKIDGKYPSDLVAASKNIARKLASYAIARGSTDNISIYVVIFK